MLAWISLAGMRIAFLVLDRPLTTQLLLRRFSWLRQIYILPFHSIKHNIQKNPAYIPSFPLFLAIHPSFFLRPLHRFRKRGTSTSFSFRQIQHKGNPLPLPLPAPHHTPHAPLPHSPPSTPFPLPTPSINPLPPSPFLSPPLPFSFLYSSPPPPLPAFFSSTPSNPPLFSHPHHRTRTSKP